MDLLEAGTKVVLEAEPPATPTFPKPRLMTAAGFVGSIFVAGLLAFVREYFDTSLRSGHQVERAFGVPCFGYVPQVRAGRHRQEPYAYLLNKPRSAYAEAIEGVRVGIEIAGGARTGHGPQIVLVTSSVPDEGKTTLTSASPRRRRDRGSGRWWWTWIFAIRACSASCT